LGSAHFLIVDNASDDGTPEFLADQPDVSLWTTSASYKRSRFGADWMNWLQRRHGHGHWTITVDADEFLVYPYCDTRPVQALTDWLDSSSLRAFPRCSSTCIRAGASTGRPTARAGPDGDHRLVRQRQLHDLEEPALR
jgi:hypothetical protein